MSNLTPGNSQNIPEGHTPRTYSNFPIKHEFFNTERYAELTPFLCLPSVKNDKLPIRSSHQVMTYTLKSPLMQNVIKYKDLFSVPMEAILPLNWEKFFDNPVRGDDVSSDVGPTIENFWQKAYNTCSNMYTALISNIWGAGTPVAENVLNGTFRWLVFNEMLYSNGSLLATLNCHGAPYFSYTEGGKTRSMDYLFDKIVTTIIPYIEHFVFVSDGITYHCYPDADTQSYDRDNRYPLRHYLSLLRDDLTTYISAVYFNTGKQLSDLITDLLNATQILGTISYSPAAVPLNTAPLSAYQLCCAHYHSNDHVDFIYSAELFRQLIGNYLSYFSTYTTHFTRNGIKYQYDYLSAHALGLIVDAQNSSYWTNVLKVTNGTATADVNARAKLGLICAILSFRRSLKYQDYFAGSRTSPLAVGSNSIPVVANTVDVIDVTKNIAWQRFRNAVNRVPHNFEGYLKGIFGGKLPAPDFHNPFHLATVSDSIYGDETMNTGDAQINPNGQSEPIAITTNLRGSASKYMFEVKSDRPCIIIGITRYDVPRIHLTSMDRHFLHVDRYDMFNPYFQYTGDQPVYVQELGAQPMSVTTLQNFAYSLKYMEYKQKYAYASGGFVENLPGWIFPAYDRRGLASPVISPEWIRSVQSEFDSFYVSLTGYSLGTYFHFIVANHNDMSGTRPMAYAPEILG